MALRPLIGITAFTTHHAEFPHIPLYALTQKYVSAVESAGGAPVILPPGLEDDSLRAIFGRIDGLLLSGGGDVDPACYGEAPHPTLTGLSAERDRIELALARLAANQDKPLLTICRGIQVLNVALGGSLVQDIPSQLPGSLTHMFDQKTVAREKITHRVAVAPETQLRQVLGADQAGVNSWHHQSIKQLAPGLRIAASAPDGVIEAVEMPGHRYTIGVQWHPEWLYDRQPEMKRLFEALVQAAS